MERGSGGGEYNGERTGEIYWRGVVGVVNIIGRELVRYIRER